MDSAFTQTTVEFLEFVSKVTVWVVIPYMVRWSLWKRWWDV